MTDKTLLDASTLSIDQDYTCKNGTHIDMRQFLDKFYVAVQALAAAGTIETNESFGFAMVEPFAGEADFGEMIESWNDPSKFVWFVGGWGPDKDRYIANAVRKMRASLRTGTSTLDLRSDAPDLFKDKVEQANEDGTFPWGDFPRGGAAFVDVFGVTLLGAVSCLHEIEDDIVVKLILGTLAKVIAIGDGLIPEI